MCNFFYKSLIRMLPAICLVPALVCTSGCGTTQETIKKNTLIRADAPTRNTDLITVGFIQTGKESDWRDANTNDYLNTFTEANGYELIYIDGNSSSERQIKAAYDLIAQDVDYMIIDPIIETGWDEVLMLADEKDISVLISDRGVSADPSLYECWIGSDFETEGTNAARWLEEYLISVGRESEDINIVLLEGTVGASAAIGRTAGLEKEFAKHDNWHILTQQSADFTQGEGTKVMKKILVDFNPEDIDVVISENDNMMFGAMKAMDQAGVAYGLSSDIITISFDALHEAFELMQQGKLMVSVECNPLIAGLAHQAIQDLEAGKEISPIYYVEESIFTYENASEYISERKY